MRKFDLSKLDEDIAVNCKTEEDANAFLEYLDSIGITWFGKTKIFETDGYNFYTYNEQTCFTLMGGGLLYSPREWYKEEGFKILDLSEIEVFEQSSEQGLLNKTKDYNSKLIPQCNFQKSHHIHYIKFPLTENLSIRYFFSFQNQPEKGGKFYMKNHKEKTYSEIDIETVKELLSNFCKEKGIEIIGRRVGKNYRKVIISEGVLISEIE